MKDFEAIETAKDRLGELLYRMMYDEDTGHAVRGVCRRAVHMDRMFISNEGLVCLERPGSIGHYADCRAAEPAGVAEAFKRVSEYGYKLGKEHHAAFARDGECFFTLGAQIYDVFPLTEALMPLVTEANGFMKLENPKAGDVRPAAGDLILARQADFQTRSMGWRREQKHMRVDAYCSVAYAARRLRYLDELM